MLLTPKQKLVFQLHRRQGLQQIAIAKQLRITPESVCRLLARAESRLCQLVKICPHGSQCDLLDAVLQ